MYLTLIYRVVDDELPPTADLLSDYCIKRVYNAEDATVLGQQDLPEFAINSLPNFMIF